jgi:hypothetical protein
VGGLKINVKLMSSKDVKLTKRSRGGRRICPLRITSHDNPAMIIVSRWSPRITPVVIRQRAASASDRGELLQVNAYSIESEMISVRW